MFVADESMRKYFDDLDSATLKCYGVTNKARAKGLDPDKEASILLADNLAGRVEGLTAAIAPQIKDSGLKERIQELEEKYGLQDWRVACVIALEVAQEKFCSFDDKRFAMETGIRVGFAYVTVGVVASPLEGFVRLELKERKDGKEYFCLYYSGPVRSAGGTGASVSLVLADYVRVHMGYGAYDPDEKEMKRTFSELDFYHERITNLQYFPSSKECEFMTQHLPLQVDGDPSEKLEVPNYKDLPRVSTNRIRSGFCLVMGEGICQKAPKVWKQLSKWGEEMGIGHWKFLGEFVTLQKEIKSKGSVAVESDAKIQPDFTFIKDLVAGRPIVSYPLSVGGLRLRYGRCRTSGFSGDAMSPASLVVLDKYIAIGTQFKIERPGKGTTISVCDVLEGPIVKLKDGSVVFVENAEHAEEINEDIEEIIFLGDILVNYGDFLNRAHSLVPAGYCEEWWGLELEKAVGDSGDCSEILKDVMRYKISFEEAYGLSLKYGIPLHPRFTFHWKDVSLEQLQSLLGLVKHHVLKDDRVILPFEYDLNSSLSEEDPKRVLELLGIPHFVTHKEYLVLEGDWAKAFRCSLGFYSKELDRENFVLPGDFKGGSLDFVNSLSEAVLRDKSGIFIGARMGRPEKAKMRKLTGSPHVLFPVGEEGGRLRCFQSSLEKGVVTGQFSLYHCSNCNEEVVFSQCPFCHSEAKKVYYSRDRGIIHEKEDGEDFVYPYKTLKLDIHKYFNAALKRLGMQAYPELIKGVRGTSNKEHIPEPLEKGILRAVHGIYVNKDGTTRYDMTEQPLTHFKAKEIGTSVEQLKNLGYVADIHGKELVSDEQIIELKCQDVVLPACPDSLEEGADAILFRVCRFIDDLLEKFYKVERFYNLEKPSDLVGHLLVSLSPHTSAGVLNRIIGFSKTQGMLAHPLLHSLMRRDVDGDEAGVMMLMDALLNFSPKLLSDHRGARQDEPLVLSTKIIPAEVDDMIFDMDVAWKYPLELYEAALEYRKPWDVKVEIFNSRLNTEGQYVGLGFTHDTSDLNSGVLCSSYKTIPSMQDKVLGQMAIAERLRAVKEADVARLIIERHFIRDLKGNLRKFSMQQFRCVGCNSKFRRPPLKGSCTKCSGKIIFTISEGSVIKYLEPSLSLAEKYDLPVYLRQTLELAKQRIDTVFGKEDEMQEGLGKWFG